MVNPQFVQEEQITLADAEKIILEIEKRDAELNYRSNKAKEYLGQFARTISAEKSEELRKALENLNLTRLKSEHIVKITDFLPKTVDDLKIVLQAYPLSMPKKDQEAIVGAVKSILS